MLEIYVEGQRLDLKPNQEIAITFDNPLFESDRIPIAVSTQIEIESTTSMRALFGFMHSMLATPIKQKISADIFVAGLPILSGEINFEEFSDNTLKYTFVGAELDDALSRELYHITLPSYYAESGFIEKARSGVYPDFGLPQLIRSSSADKIEYRVSRNINDYPEVDVLTKYANYLYYNDKNIVPAIKVRSIFESLFTNFTIKSQLIDSYFDCLAVLGNNMIIAENDINLTSSLPAVDVSDFIRDVLNITGSSLFCAANNYMLISNKDVISASDFVDWTSKISDTYSLLVEEGCGYEFSVNNDADDYVDSDEISEEPVDAPTLQHSDTLTGVIVKIGSSDDYISVKHTPTGDIFTGRKIVAYPYYTVNSVEGRRILDESVNVATLNIAHQSNFISIEEVVDSSTESYDASVNACIPRCVSLEMYNPFIYIAPGEPYPLPNRLFSVTPLVEISGPDDTRSSNVYLGLLIDNNFVDKGVTISSTGEERTSELTLAINGDNGLWNRFHKDFAEWLQKPKTVCNVDLSLMPQDVANFKIWQKYMFYNRLFFFRSIEMTFNTSSNVIKANADIVEA